MLIRSHLSLLFLGVPFVAALSLSSANDGPVRKHHKGQTQQVPPWACPLSQAWSTYGPSENIVVAGHIEKMTVQDLKPLEQPTFRDVVELDMSNWKEFTGKAEHNLILFYAPWCPHCQSFVGANGTIADQEASPWHQYAAHLRDSEFEELQSVQFGQFSTSPQKGVRNLVPKGYEVGHIPRVAYVESDGQLKDWYFENPDDLTALTEWLLQNFIYK